MRIEPTARFKREFKRLTRKYPSLKGEVSEVVKNLHETPELGVSIGNDCFKIRLAIASKGTGKRGGARIVTYVRVINERIDLLSIYDKSEQSDISDKDLLKIINDIEEI